MSNENSNAPVAAAAAPPVQMIHVSNVNELYEEVNNPDNEGKTIVLASGVVYYLEGDNNDNPSRGPLTLQKDMSLMGQEGHADQVVIDASRLQQSAYLIPRDTNHPFDLEKGAIRLGNGNNSVEWITFVHDSNNFIRALIETDFAGESNTRVKIAHNIIKDSSIGINIVNWRIEMNGRIVVAEIEDNEIFNNVKSQFAAGIQIQNSHGVNGAVINVALKDNRIHGNGTGLAVLNAQCSGNTIRVHSENDRIEDNNTGLNLRAGVGTNRELYPGDNNSIVFEARGTSIRNNNFQQSQSFSAGGAIVIGGYRSNTNVEVPFMASKNKLEARFFDSLFENNSEPQIKVYGAYSEKPLLIAGEKNKVNVHLNGLSRQTSYTEISSFPDESTETNKAKVTPSSL